jgi:YHS domain-containing protein
MKRRSLQVKIRNFALALALASPVSMQFAAAQDTKKADQKPVKEAQDPVCGMMVDTATAPKSDYKGKSYYFCSIDEKKEFDKAPATYIKVEKKDTTKK